MYLYYHTLCIFCKNATEDNIKKVLLDQQELRQNETTRAISFHIASDFDSIIARLALIANSISGNLSGDVIQKILNEQYPEVGSNIAYPAQFVMINRNGIVVTASPQEGPLHLNENLTGQEYLERVELLRKPIVSVKYQNNNSNRSIIISLSDKSKKHRPTIGISCCQLSLLICSITMVIHTELTLHILQYWTKTERT